MGRVVITGLGLVGAFGFDVSSFWAALQEPPSSFSTFLPGHSALPPLAGLPAAPVDRARLMTLLPGKGIRALNFEAALLVVAATRALDMAGIPPRARGDFGLSVGTRWGGMDDYAEFWLERLTWGPKRVSPSRGPNTGANAAACHTSIKLGLQGPNLTVSSRRTSAGEALLSAAAFVQGGKAPGMLAGGVEALSYVRSSQAMAQSEEPTAARPLGEGAALLVLEDEELARARGARPLAVLGARGRAFCPGHVSEAVNQAARVAAASSAAVQALRVDAAFGPAGWGAAPAAVQGLRAVLGNRPEPRLYAIDEWFGDWEGGGAALHAAAAALALQRRRWPTGGGAGPGEFRPGGAVLIHSSDPAGHALALIIHPGAADA